MARIRPMLRAHGLSEQQWRILRLLATEQELEITQLAELAYMHMPSVSRILVTMHKDGLILRRTAEHDARRSLVAISDKGLALIEEVAPDAIALAQNSERRYGADRMARLKRLLGELEEALSNEALES